MSWKPIDYSSDIQARQWRAKLSKLLAVRPEDIKDWDLQHLMREIEGARKRILEQSSEQ